MFLPGNARFIGAEKSMIGYLALDHQSFLGPGFLCPAVIKLSHRMITRGNEIVFYDVDIINYGLTLR